MIFMPPKPTYEELEQRLLEAEQAVSAQKESKQRYRRLAENSPDMLYRMSLPDGDYVYVSPAAKTIFGYPPEAWYENPLLIKDLIHPDFYSYFEEQWKNLLGGQVPPSYDYKIIHKDKTERWINQRNSLIRDDSGRPIALEGVATDVTGQRNAQRALLESESRLKTIVNTIPDLVWLKDPDGVYLSCNPRFERFFGAKEAVIVGKTDYDFVDKELADFFRDHDLKAMGLDKPSMNEEWLTFADDGYHGLFETIKTPMRSPDGKLIGVLGIARDISKRKQAEEALKETERRLREAQKMTNLGFWFWDVHSGEVEWTDEVYKIFRLDPDEFTPQIDSIQALSPWPEDHQRDRELIQKAMENDEPGAYEQKFFFPDGSIGHYYSTFEGVYDDQGKLAAIKGTVQDITGKKRAEEEKQKMEKQLAQAQKMESVGRLAGGVAHDFNNMLSIILGNAEIIMEDIDPLSPLVKNLEEILKAADRSAGLTRQLLAFARRQTINPQILDLNHVIHDMLNMLKRLIGEDIDLTWQPARNLRSVKIDPSQIDQILANLCVNARDAIKGVGKVTIQTDHIVFDDAYCRQHPGSNPGDHVMMAITDNGSGMEKKTLDNLFEPFFTTKDLGQGTGLGLATVYGIVKQNKGFIDVSSQPGKGTTFRIYFPAYSKMIISKQKPLAKASRTGNETILLVEDEKPLLKMAQAILERLGYTVFAAYSPHQAISIVKDPGITAIDLLITDVILPEMNGRDLSKKLLSLRPGLKCLFMSGYTDNVIAHHGVLDAGVQFINKPFSKQDLAAKVRDVLDGGT